MKIKRLVVYIIALLVVFFVFVSCTQINSGEKFTENISTTNTVNAQSDFSETNQSLTDNKSSVTEGVGGGVLRVQKYRDMFYSVPAPFVNLVGKEIFFEWHDTINATSTAETMVMPQFIQHFGITREQFDKANLEWAKGIRDNLDGIPCINPKDYANQITDEVFNGDIIFTFDDDLIREYYLSPDYPYVYDFEYEEAIANGEYTSQTEEWVDIEAMEAEIIAKYGEAEIVTETPQPEINTEVTSISEQTTA